MPVSQGNRLRKNTGKPLGNDIRDNKVTLPMMYALRQAEKKESRKIIKLIKKKAKKTEIKEIISFVENHGGIEYAMQKANDYVNVAKKSLEIYPDTTYKRSLDTLVDFVTSREA